jgi:hypothetical protein
VTAQWRGAERGQGAEINSEGRAQEYSPQRRQSEGRSESKVQEAARTEGGTQGREASRQEEHRAEEQPAGAQDDAEVGPESGSEERGPQERGPQGRAHTPPPLVAGPRRGIGGPTRGRISGGRRNVRGLRDAHAARSK